MRRVTATIPAYWEKEFQRALDRDGSESAEFVRAAIYAHVQNVNLAHPETFSQEPNKDLYMKAAPERLKALSKFESPQVCIRGQEIGEDHIIEPGDLYSWVRFSRDSQSADWIKNGKLCRECYGIAKDMYTEGNVYF